MTWLRNVIERRNSKEEIDWINLIGTDAPEVKNCDRYTQKCTKQYQILNLKIEPKWFQQLSDRQIKGLDLLYDAVREDYDRKESHRTFYLLKFIGLHPVPHHCLIKRALMLSRGHELAFLWFLSDICYRTFNKHASTSDYSLNERILLMSICHLDMITTLRQLDVLMPDPDISNFESDTIPNKKNLKKKYFSPYLEPSPLPKMPEIQEKNEKPSYKKLNLYPYNDWNNFEVVPKNTKNRWYIYRSKNQKKPPPTPKPSKEIMVKEILEDTLDGLSSFQGDSMKNLCLKHREENIQTDKKKRIQCLLEFNRNDFKSELSKELLEQIDKDVIEARANLEKITKNFETNVIICGMVQEMLTKAAAQRFVQPCSDCQSCKLEFDSYKKLLTQKLQCDDSKETTISLQKRFYKYEKKFCNEYFKAPSSSSPYYEFDFSRIFAQEYDKCDCNNRINEALKCALETQESPHFAVDKIFTEMWEKELIDWKELQELKKSITPSPSSITEKDFKIPKNQKSIQSVLKKFLTQMARDPYFMLASLPDAHKLPILEAWVRNRYNLKISPKQQRKNLLKNEYQWVDLKPTWVSTRPPTNQDICPCIERTTTFDNHDRLHALKDTKKARHERCLKQNLINMNRIFWKSFAAGLCAPRMHDIFYAYNPGAERELHPKRPWYTYEH